MEEIITPHTLNSGNHGHQLHHLKRSCNFTRGNLFTLHQRCTACVGGVTVGSLFIYILAYFLGKEFVVRWGRYLGVSWENIEKSQNKFEESRSDEVILFRFIRYNLKKFVIITFSGTMIRAFILGFLGWQFGSFYQTISTEISYIEEICLVIIIIAIIIYILNKKYRK